MKKNPGIWRKAVWAVLTSQPTNMYPSLSSFFSHMHKNMVLFPWPPSLQCCPGMLSSNPITNKWLNVYFVPGAILGATEARVSCPLGPYLQVSGKFKREEERKPRKNSLLADQWPPGGANNSLLSEGSHLRTSSCSSLKCDKSHFTLWPLVIYHICVQLCPCMQYW
jgi:hypothetical protein